VLKWQEIKPKPGAMWPTGRSGFQLFVYQDDVSKIPIPLYGANFCFKLLIVMFLFTNIVKFSHVLFVIIIS
jgi:hypothetical protein